MQHIANIFIINTVGNYMYTHMLRPIGFLTVDKADSFPLELMWIYITSLKLLAQASAFSWASLRRQNLGACVTELLVLYILCSQDQPHL